MGKVAPSNYLHQVLAQIKEDHDLPDIWYLDLWPFGPEMIICSDGEAAALATTVSAYPQSHVVVDFFTRAVGKYFLEAANHTMWKEIHHMLAPGFTPNAVRSYHSLIVDQTALFHRRLCEFADGDTFDLLYELGKCPFEVVWHIFFGTSHNTQINGSPIYQDISRLNDLAAITMMSKNPFEKWRAARDRSVIMKRIGVVIEEHIASRFAVLKATKTLPTRTSAASLLDRMLLPHLQNGQPLDDRLINMIKDK